MASRRKRSTNSCVLGEALVQKLDRDAAAELEVLGAVDLGHAAGADARRRRGSGRRSSCRRRSGSVIRAASEPADARMSVAARSGRRRLPPKPLSWWSSDHGDLAVSEGRVGDEPGLLFGGARRVCESCGGAGLAGDVMLGPARAFGAVPSLTTCSIIMPDRWRGRGLHHGAEDARLERCTRLTVGVDDLVGEVRDASAARRWRRRRRPSPSAAASPRAALADADRGTSMSAAGEREVARIRTRTPLGDSSSRGGRSAACVEAEPACRSAARRADALRDLRPDGVDRVRQRVGERDVAVARAAVVARADGRRRSDGRVAVDHRARRVTDRCRSRRSRSRPSGLEPGGTGPARSLGDSGSQLTPRPGRVFTPLGS